jgi:YD repeat-containing protein
VTYAYDPDKGYLESVTDAESHETTYEYDSLGRKITETDPLGNSRHWVYNAFNR